MQALLSIIIPCYNSERFLAKTLDMLISQGVQNCEVIIINDGSTDRTSEIAHSYANRYENCVVIDKENEGVSVARNIGILSATGEYIYFLDSDDSLTDGTLDYFRKTITENTDTQFFAFAYKSIDENSHVKKYCFTKYGNKKIDNFSLQKIYLTKRISFNICSCIFERAFLLQNKIFFTKGQKIGEDVCFLLKVISFAPNCFYFSRICFLYQIRNDSSLQRSQGYTLDKYQALLGYEKTLNSLYSKDEIICYSNFFYQIRFLNHLRGYLCSSFADDSVTSCFEKNLVRFKDKIAFGNFYFTVILFFLHLIPTKLIEKRLKRKKQQK